MLQEIGARLQDEPVGEERPAAPVEVARVGTECMALRRKRDGQLLHQGRGRIEPRRRRILFERRDEQQRKERHCPLFATASTLLRASTARANATPMTGQLRYVASRSRKAPMPSSMTFFSSPNEACRTTSPFALRTTNAMWLTRTTRRGSGARTMSITDPGAICAARSRASARGR